MLTSTGALDEPFRTIDAGADVVVVGVAAAAVATCRDEGIDVLLRCHVPMRTRSPWAAWRATADMIADFFFGLIFFRASESQRAFGQERQRKTNVVGNGQASM